MPKFLVLKGNVVPFARNAGEVVEIATPSEYEKYLAEGAIEQLEGLNPEAPEKPKKKAKKKR